MAAAKEEVESESSLPAPPRRLDAYEGNEEEEESMIATVLHAYLHTPPVSSAADRDIADIQRTFSAIAWCAKSGLLACGTEVCARDARLNTGPLFWIPIHIIHPERPTEHAVFNVNADSMFDYVQFLEWSPPPCTRALLIGTSSGRVTIWMQPSEGMANAAQALNCWKCEHEWQQEPAAVTKWLSGVTPYRWTPAAGGLSKPSFEDRFVSHQSRAPVRWPNILCICSVSLSGYAQLHWCQWPPLGDAGKQNWFATRKGVLGTGKSDLISADAIVGESGTLLIAGVPFGNSSSVVVWEVTPLFVNSQGTVQQIIVGLQSWPGIASLPAVLLSWHEWLGNEMRSVTDNSAHLPGVEVRPQTLSAYVRSQEPPASGNDVNAPSLHCSVVSYFSAYATSETDISTKVGTGSGVTTVAFDPSKGGSVLVVLLNEGYYYVAFPDERPSLIGYRVLRYESSRQQTGVHPLFEPVVPTPYSSTPLSTGAVIWRSNIDKCILINRKGEAPVLQSVKSCTDPYEIPFADKLMNVKSYSKIVFSPHGGELAVVIPGGDVHIYSGSSLTPIDSYSLKVGNSYAAPSFSPAGCCLSTIWHDAKKDCSVLKIHRVFPPALPAMQGTNNSSTWERGLADRFWWSLVAEVDWWDVVGCTQSAVEENLVTFHKVVAVLDTDFHSLPLLHHRQHYGPALDRIKCRMLEGVDGSDVRAVVLDMQARLLLEMLGKGIEAALVNPTTFITEPWMASSEKLIGLVHDVMTVDPALVSYIQPYNDAVLDLASHFLTRLRRYASFCRTLATAAGSQSSNSSNARLSTAPASAAGSSTGSSQGSQVSSAYNNGTTSVQAWMQGAIAKVNNSTEGAASMTPSSTTGAVPPLQLNVSQSAFPGMPAVRLVGDCNFLHRLCQLLLFCFIFRRRQQSRGSLSVSPVEGSEEFGGGRSGRFGNGNGGQGYTADDVKFLFLVSVTLCKKTSSLLHPMPKTQCGSPNPLIRLHYPDGQYSVAPEVVEASLGQHIQHLPRPRGADSAGLLMRELELHPPAEDWSKRNLFGGPWAGTLELYPTSHEKESFTMMSEWQSPIAPFLGEEASKFKDLWPRKRRISERDVAFGLSTAASMGSFIGFMGSRRDTITALWKNSTHGIWHKCIRCGRQTCALVRSNGSLVANSVDSWWTGRHAYACPICGGSWIQVV
ncbi:hypothetical protein KP509_22G016300 [Ceratopteris richardii]|uniref:Mediator of RNA polymerase II transcription subunit 16 n=1 Tax=Ceratopteris richardii TaxID=49495 RepID=A0A8T2S2X9_CERRI|nr:hypothetical protein KP509_22G016300 [Ceratopteris richardii]